MHVKTRSAKLGLHYCVSLFGWVFFFFFLSFFVPSCTIIWRGKKKEGEREGEGEREKERGGGMRERKLREPEMYFILF